jgi:ribose-phosphate pyrophosphokinase
MMPAGDLLLFALEASRPYGEAVARALGRTLSAHEEREFEDGEHKTRPLVSVRGRDVFVVQSLHADAAQSVNDRLVRLLFFLGALKDASAARVTAVTPYLAYARKDRKTKARDPVTTRYVAGLFEAVGADCVVTMDVHNLAAFQNAFRCRAENLEAAPLFVTALLPLVRTDEVVVVSPDAGGIKRADAFRERLAAALDRPVGAAFAEKYRSRGVVSGDALVGDVEGRTAIIIDDLVSAGNTLARAAHACRAKGAARVLAAATHGVFAPQADAVLGPAEIERIFVTDTIAPRRDFSPALQARLAPVATAERFAEAIRRLHEGGSLTELAGG